MNTKNERVKLLREALGLSMEKFGEPIGVTKSAINRIEKGNNDLSVQMAKAICRIYRVDYFWLTEGEGEMFIEFPETILDQMVEEYGLNQSDKAILKAYVQADDTQREAVLDFLKSIVKEL
jgi:transcriptional regulator with XRE-family HTH domain